MDNGKLSDWIDLLRRVESKGGLRNKESSLEFPIPNQIQYGVNFYVGPDIFHI